MLGDKNWIPNTEGFGTVRPALVFDGDYPTGFLTRVTWSSWGGPIAVGTGTGYVVAPKGSDPYEPAKVEAYDLGMCKGKLSYVRVRWWYPGKGESFDSASHDAGDNICTGDPAHNHAGAQLRRYTADLQERFLKEKLGSSEVVVRIEASAKGWALGTWIGTDQIERDEIPPQAALAIFKGDRLIFWGSSFNYEELKSSGVPTEILNSLGYVDQTGERPSQRVQPGAEGCLCGMGNYPASTASTLYVLS